MTIVVPARFAPFVVAKLEEITEAIQAGRVPDFMVNERAPGYLRVDTAGITEASGPVSVVLLASEVGSS